MSTAGGTQGKEERDPVCIKWVRFTAIAIVHDSEPSQPFQPACRHQGRSWATNILSPVVAGLVILSFCDPGVYLCRGTCGTDRLLHLHSADHGRPRRRRLDAVRGDSLWRVTIKGSAAGLQQVIDRLTAGKRESIVTNGATITAIDVGEVKE